MGSINIAGRVLSRTGLAMVFVGLLAVPASSQSEQSVVKAMRSIEAAWRSALREKRWLVSRCAQGTYSMIRFSATAVILRVDVERTASLMSRYRGIIEISASLETNSQSPRANGFTSEVALGPRRVVCFRSMDEARAAVGPGDIGPFNVGLVYRMQAEYGIEGNRLVLRSGNAVFVNAVGRTLVNVENAQGWAKVVAAPLR